MYLNQSCSSHINNEGGRIKLRNLFYMSFISFPRDWLSWGLDCQNWLKPVSKIRLDQFLLTVLDNMPKPALANFYRTNRPVPVSKTSLGHLSMENAKLAQKDPNLFFFV